MEVTNPIKPVQDAKTTEGSEYNSTTMTPDVVIRPPRLSKKPSGDTPRDTDADKISGGSDIEETNAIEMVLPPMRDKWFHTRQRGIDRGNNIRNFIHGFLDLLADVTEWCTDCLEACEELDFSCSELSCEYSDLNCDCNGCDCSGFDCDF